MGFMQYCEWDCLKIDPKYAKQKWNCDWNCPRKDTKYTKE